jgi:hypothetical protein
MWAKLVRIVPYHLLVAGMRRRPDRCIPQRRTAANAALAQLSQVPPRKVVFLQGPAIALAAVEDLISIPLANSELYRTACVDCLYRSSNIFQVYILRLL